MRGALQRGCSRALAGAVVGKLVADADGGGGVGREAALCLQKFALKGTVAVYTDGQLGWGGPRE